MNFTVAVLFHLFARNVPANLKDERSLEQSLVTTISYPTLSQLKKDNSVQELEIINLLLPDVFGVQVASSRRLSASRMQ